MRSRVCFDSSSVQGKLLVKCSKTTYNAADKEDFEEGREGKITAKQQGHLEGANGEDIKRGAC